MYMYIYKLSIWRSRLDILDIYRHSIKHSKNKIDSNPTNTLWNDLVLNWLKLFLNSNQGLANPFSTEIDP